MNAKRSANRVPELSVRHAILLGKQLDAFGLAGTLYFHRQLPRQVPDVDACLFRRDGRLEEDPEMTSAAALLQRSLNACLAQFEL